MPGRRVTRRHGARWWAGVTMVICGSLVRGRVFRSLRKCEDCMSGPIDICGSARIINANSMRYEIYRSF